MEVKQGIFYGVGVGPGDPELLTAKALGVLEACPVLACPQTKSGEMLALDIVRGAMDVSGKEILPLRFAMSRDKAVQQAAHREAAEAVCRFLAAHQPDEDERPPAHRAGELGPPPGPGVAGQ